MPDATVYEWLSARTRLVGSAILIGGVLSGTGVVILSLTEGTRFASEHVFALCALVFGFGLLGWSSAALSGQALVNAQHHLDTSTDWTETNARRAMARICGFGVGGMGGETIITLVL